MGLFGQELYDDNIGRGSGNWVVIVFSYGLLGIAAVLSVVGLIALTTGIADKIRITSVEDEQLESPEPIGGKPPEQIRQEYSSVMRKQWIVIAIALITLGSPFVAYMYGIERPQDLEGTWLIGPIFGVLAIAWFFIFVFKCPNCGKAPGSGLNRQNCQSCGVQLRE
jgi:uncharacterized membrane protein